MSSISRAPAERRGRSTRGSRLVSSLAVAALVGLSALSGVDAASARPQADSAPTVVPPGAQHVSGGSLNWGVRASIRNYLENFDHTAGWIEARQGAKYRKGQAYIEHPKATGWVNDDEDTASLTFAGEVQFFGFGESWMWYDHVRLDIANKKASIVADMKESYNVKVPTKDLVIATFDLGDDAIKVKDGTVTITSSEGTFSHAMAYEHLPQLGGEPSYGEPNDYTDPFTLALALEEAAPQPDPIPTPTAEPTPVPTTPVVPAPTPTVPADPPYGTSTGKSLEGSTATISVTPGYALHADAPTTVTIKGTGFDPGPGKGEAGYGQGGIYVVIGQAEPGESWRRSKGGLTGPEGDLNYGLPRFVGYQGSADGDVADGVMDENGNWQYELTIPKGSFESFFGDTLNCVERQCGVYSFGAHGVVNAANEATTLIHFVGDGSEKTWPPRPAPAPDPTPAPTPGPTPVPTPDPKPTPTPDPNPTPTPAPVEKNPHGESTGTNAAGAQLTVTPAYELGDSKQVITLKGTNYPTSNKGSNFGGAYILFGWVDPKAENGWGPSMRGRGGFEYIYIEGEENQSMVSYPGNTTVPGYPVMDKNGNWETSFTIDTSRFTAFGKQIDCYKMQCGVITIGAHGQANAAAEVFTPVYFNSSSQQPPAPEARPEIPADPTDPGAFPPPINPGGVNLSNGAVSGAKINTGIAEMDTSGRTIAIGGVLLMACGALSLALARSNRLSHRGDS